MLFVALRTLLPIVLRRPGFYRIHFADSAIPECALRVGLNHMPSNSDGPNIRIDGAEKQLHSACTGSRSYGICAEKGREELVSSKNRENELLSRILCFVCQSTSRDLGTGIFSARVTGG